MLVPLLVLVLGLGAGAAITALYLDADHSRTAQVEIGALRLDLENLQSGAFRSNPRSGGSPAAAREAIAASKAGIARHVGYLTEDESAPAELDRLGPAIRGLYPSTHELYLIGAYRGGFTKSPQTDVLLKWVTQEDRDRRPARPGRRGLRHDGGAHANARDGRLRRDADAAARRLPDPLSAFGQGPA